MKRARQLLNRTEKQLLKDLLLTATEVLQKRKKRFSHLRFARPTTHGWFFFKKKKVEHELLDEITKNVSALHPHYREGMIADILSELVNFTQRDMSHLQTLL